MMRIVFLFIILVLATGCSSYISGENTKLDISLLNASHSESFDVEKNKTIDSIAFTMLNNEDDILGCAVLLNLDNSTNVSSHRVDVGSLQPKASKKVNISFEMFSGNTSLRILPDCKKAS